MASVEQILDQSVPRGNHDGAPAGAGTMGGEPPPVHREELVKLLTGAMRRNEALFYACFIAAALLLLVNVIGVILIVQSGNVGRLKALTAALGLPASGLLLWMIRLWREKNEAERVVILLKICDDRQLTKYVDKILRRA